MAAAQAEIDTEWWKVWKNRRYIVSLMICFGMMNLYATRINLSVAIVAMTEKNDDHPEGEFYWTSQEKGFILSSFFYGYALMQVPVGIILKYVPPHIMFGVGGLVSALLTALTPFIAQQFYLLITVRVIMGAFQAIAVPGTVSLMSNWAPPLERSKMAVINVSGAFIGTVLCLPISGVVGDNFGWQWIFYVFAITTTFWCLLWFACIRSVPQNDRLVSKRELEYIVNSIGEKTEGKQKIPVPWSGILLSLPVWALAISNFSWGWGFQTMLAQLPPFLRDVAGFDLTKNGLLSSLPYITMTVMSWTAGYIADLLQVKGFSTTQVRKSFISVTLAIQFVFIMIAAFVFNPAINIFCISMSIGFGAFTYAAIGVNPLDLTVIFSPIIAAISSMFGTITGIISPIVVGYIVTADENDGDQLKSQWQIVFFIVAGIYATGSVIYWLGGSGEVQPWAKGKVEKSIEAGK